MNHQLTKLAGDARAMSGPSTPTTSPSPCPAGAVQRVKEFLAINAC